VPRRAPQVLGLTGNVRKMFRDMDEGLYEECRLRYEAEQVRTGLPLSSWPHANACRLLPGVPQPCQSLLPQLQACGVCWVRKC
jgi:hypothetical protein